MVSILASSVNDCRFDLVTDQAKEGDLPLPLQSVLITNEVVSSIPTQEVALNSITLTPSTQRNQTGICCFIKKVTRFCQDIAEKNSHLVKKT